MALTEQQKQQMLQDSKELLDRLNPILFPKRVEPPTYEQVMGNLGLAIFGRQFFETVKELQEKDSRPSN